MADDPPQSAAGLLADRDAATRDRSALIAAARARTPARAFVGRAGPSYRTDTQLALREDHAAAVDAVRAELDLDRDLGREFVATWGIFAVASRATSRAEYLLRPDLGRRLDAGAAAALGRCPVGADLQVVVGDGLSAAAVARQVPALLPLLAAGAARRGWGFGQPFFVRRCRVGAINDIGDLLRPTVVVLLIGERPGLATAESLSAYLAYRPRGGQTDADRNLVANIHDRGTPPAEAAGRIIRLAALLMDRQLGGVAIKEEAAAADEIGPPPCPGEP